MRLSHYFAIAAATAASPAIAQSGSIYAEMLVEGSVDRNIECAATIFALGEGTDLAAVIAVFFIEDATGTLVTLGGWEDREAASLSVQSRVAVKAEDIQLANTPADDLVQRQFECVMSRFKG
ncbi:MAG: hypothetical protein U1E48_05935 [Paracoccaceae bacterium]